VFLHPGDGSVKRQGRLPRSSANVVCIYVAYINSHDTGQVQGPCTSAIKEQLKSRQWAAGRIYASLPQKTARYSAISKKTI
jgi:hypothetical protein